MNALINIFKEHRVQLGVGFFLASLAAGVMALYENDFEHRYDENFRGVAFDRVVSLDTIENVVAGHFQMKGDQLTSKRVDRASEHARGVAIYLADDLRVAPLKEIASRFSGGDEIRMRELAQAVHTRTESDKAFNEQSEKLARACDEGAELRDIFPAGYKRLWGHEWLEALELRTYDSRFEQRGPLKSPDNIIIVAYDDETADAVKVWPFPRLFHAHVVEKLKQAGAAVICFDTRFDAFQKYKEIKDFMRFDNILEPHPGDLAFAAAARKAGNVFVTADVLEEKSDWRKMLETMGTGVPYMSFPYRDEEGFWERGYGISRKPYDSDGHVRRSYLGFTVTNPNTKKQERYASLATLVAGFYAQEQKKQEFDEEKLCAELARGRFNGRKVPIVNGRENPAHNWHSNSALIQFQGPRSTIKTVPYYQVLSDDPAMWKVAKPEEMWRQLETLFRDKIVFVGPTMELLHDVFSTPFSSEKQKMPGVEVHANMVHGLLSHSFVRAAPRGTNLLAVFFMAYVTAFLGIVMSRPVAAVAGHVDRSLSFSIRGLKVRLYGPVWFVLYLTLGIGPPLVLYYLFALYLFIDKSLWITVVYPWATSAMSAMFITAMMFLTEEVNRRKAIGRFEHLVAPSVLAEILKHPGEAEELPKPRRVEATLIFTDLQGFTTLSEQNSAETVVDVLNEYITLMNGAIFQHGGTIDKYEGDAIMVEFGVPVPQPDHAKRAVLCAIDMQEACTKFRNEVCRKNGWPDVYVRIGVNSGEVIAGLIGGGDRFDYTTIGDTVNLAARLEPLNKQVGSWILIGDRTFDHIKDLDLVIADHVPGIQVKGKTQAVDVYAIRGLKETGRRDHIWGEDADKAPKAPTESSVGAAIKERPAPSESEPAAAGVAGA